MGSVWAAMRTSPWWIKVPAVAIAVVVIALLVTRGSSSHPGLASVGATSTVVSQPLAPGAPVLSSTSSSSTGPSTTSRSTTTVAPTTTTVKPNTTTTVSSTTTTKALAPCTASVSQPNATAASPNETVSAKSSLPGVPAKMVVNYQHIPPYSESGSTDAAGQVVFATFAVKADGQQKHAVVSVSVTIGSGAQTTSCATSFVDDV